jgi:hypothetical protein
VIAHARVIGIAGVIAHAGVIGIAGVFGIGGLFKYLRVPRDIVKGLRSLLWRCDKVYGQISKNSVRIAGDRK